MKPVLVYNWKTYITSKNDAATLAGALEGSDDVTVVACPSALHMTAVAEVLDANVLLGAQDIAVSSDHPQTGSLSGAQLRDVGASYALVGHAETRATGVTNGAVGYKVVHALASGLTPIVCLSEQKDDADQNPGIEVSEQLKEIIDISGDSFTQQKNMMYSFIVAYEPTAYIGAEDTLAPEKIKYILDLLRAVLQQHTLQNTPVIYGGAVNVENVREILRVSGANGFLIGRAGTNTDTANTILRSL